MLGSVTDPRPLKKAALYCTHPIRSAALHASVIIMDKKQINDPKMTLNFLIWVGGVFVLALFAFLAHFVWKLF
jgi:hypothetical protein